MNIVGVIPARYGSTRLPGKPLLDICGKPMIWWVYKRVCLIDQLSCIYVATDDERISSVCQQYEIPVVMTSQNHQTAANRLWEVSQTIDADFYIQINGDEPLIDLNAVKEVIPDNIPKEREFGTNIITEISDPAQLFDNSNIKVTFDDQMNALFMSRTPIPYPYKAINFKYYKHVGIIGYNKRMLDFYNNSVPGRFEQIEGIDTLRFLDYGKQLQFKIYSNCQSLSVDTQKDLDLVRKKIKENFL